MAGENTINGEERTGLDLNELVKEFKNTFGQEIPSVFDTEEMDEIQIEKFKSLISLSIYYNENFLSHLAFSQFYSDEDDEYDDLWDELEEFDDSDVDSTGEFDDSDVDSTGEFEEEFDDEYIDL